VNLTSGSVDARGTLGSTAVAAEAEYITKSAQANPQGIISIPNVPNTQKLLFVPHGAAFNMAEVVTPAFDINADSVADYQGSITRLGFDSLVTMGNTASIQAALITNHKFDCTSNLVSASTNPGAVNLLPAGGPFVFVCNQPVDLGSVSVSIINSFSNDSLFNSRAQAPDERQAVDAINANTKPNGGMPTMTVTSDASKTIVYLTPNQALPAGADVRFTGSITSAVKGQDLDVGGLTPVAADPRVFQLGDGTAFGAYIAPAMPALSVQSLYLERNGGTGYNKITAVLSRAVHGYTDLGGGYILLCSKDDLNANGRNSDKDTGVLEPGECPADPTTYNFSNADITNMIHARLRTGTSPLRPATSQFWVFAATDAAAAPIFAPQNRQSLKLSVIAPFVNGAVFTGTNQLEFPDGTPVGFGFVADIDVSITSGNANVVTDFKSSQNVFAQ